jgi:hypothetical protein
MDPENRITMILNTVSVALVGKKPRAGILVSLEEETVTRCLAVEWVQAFQTVVLVLAN